MKYSYNYLVIKLTLLNFNNIKLTSLQENILIELAKNTEPDNICNKFNIKRITLSKIIKTLNNKNLYSNNKTTMLGKEMVHYITFRNKTISTFLKSANIKESERIINQFRVLDYEIIIALKNCC
jgi:hypothetical protein